MHRVSFATLTALFTSSLALPLASTLPAQSHPTQFQIDNRMEVQVQQVFHKPVFAGMSILSSVNHGVVTLSGTVTSEAAKELASSELADIEGVKTVLNNLNVLSTGSIPRPVPPQAAPVRASGIKTVTLPSGTVLPIRITDEINTKTAKANDTFHGTTVAAVNFAGYTLIPTGSTVNGRVIDAKAAGHFSGSAELAVELVSVRVPGTGGPQEEPLVTEQLSNKAAGRGANTAEKAGGGAGLGAIIGALGGGGAGAGIGAAGGGALGLGANAITRGKEIDLKPEQLLRFRTAAPLEVTVTLQNGKQVIPQTPPAPKLEQRAAEQSNPSL